MITKMKKMMLFMSNSAEQVDADLTLLGQLGVLHVKPFQPAKDESIERVDARIKQLEKAIEILSQFDEEELPNTDLAEVEDFSSVERGEILLMEKVLNVEKERIELEELREQQNKEIAWYEQWGKVSVTDILDLKKNGVALSFYLIGNKELKGLKKRDDIHVVGKVDDLNQVVLITQDAGQNLDFNQVVMPELQYDELKVAFEQTEKQLVENEATLKALYSQKVVLEDALHERIRRFDVRNIQYGGISIENQVRCWKGYLPVDAVAKFTESAKEHGWGYVIDDPDEEETDEVPTLVRSPKWAERIKPVMSFMGLMPGYNELDVSKVFMIFFTFFTGILVGDAGYGLVFFLLTLVAHWRSKFKKKVEFELIYTLSVSIMFWGVITGTYFGAEAIAKIPFLSQLVIDKLSSFGGDTVFTQKIMFIIGAVHLSIGRLQTAWKYSNSIRAIGQLGWVAIVWGLYLIVNQMVLGIEAPEFMVWLFIGGAVLVGFFSSSGKNFFKGILSSVGGLPLSIINGFSDIISYIRLYAVGLATVLMATSFNEMAIGDGISTIASGIGAVVILILGHLLNMILAGMAVIVHGVRLNMLEYAGHAGVEFSGNEYNPFKIKNKKDNNSNNESTDNKKSTSKNKK